MKLCGILSQLLQNYKIMIDDDDDDNILFMLSNIIQHMQCTVL